MFIAYLEASFYHHYDQTELYILYYRVAHLYIAQLILLFRYYVDSAPNDNYNDDDNDDDNDNDNNDDDDDDAGGGNDNAVGDQRLWMDA